MTMSIPKNKPLNIPIAHGEGRYYAPEDVLKKLHQNGQIIWRYCDSEGNLSEADCPNGSLMNIAGVLVNILYQSFLCTFAFTEVLLLLGHGVAASLNLLETDKQGSRMVSNQQR